MRITNLIIMGITLVITSSPSYSKDFIVIDADTLIQEGVSYRIYGIDAPERSQKCANGYSGENSRKWLIEFLKGKRVECTAISKDRYGRTVAVCYANGKDIGQEAVRAGHAFAYFKYSKKYVVEHFKARFKQLPVWRNNCAIPSNYRRRK